MINELMIHEREKAEHPRISIKTPTTMAMRTAINSMLTPLRKRSDIGKQDTLKDLPLSMYSQTNTAKQNKKPCPRDGHSGVIYMDRLIIFGGDRNKVTLNDLFTLNLSAVIDWRKYKNKYYIYTYSYSDIVLIS